MKYTSLFLVATGLLSGCDTLECGPGTHRSKDQCIENIQVVCGEGTLFQDGRCVGEPGAGGSGGAGGGSGGDPGGGLTCGPGTHEENGVCLPDDPGPVRDSGTGGTGGTGGAGGTAADSGVGGETDAGPGGAGGAGGTIAPDMGPPPPTCPEELTPGALPANCNVPAGENFCVVGLALDLATGCALPVGTGILLTDPVAVATGTPLENAIHGEATVGAHGVFAIIGTGMSASIGITLDEVATLRNPTPGAGTLMRSSSGVLGAAAQFGMTYQTIAFASTQAQQARWNTALAQPENFLETNGFMIGRVLTYGPAGALLPVGGARVVFSINTMMTQCPEGGHCLRFMGDTLDEFQPAGANLTGASGAFIVIRGGAGAFRDQVKVVLPDGYPDRATSCGAAPGSGFHLPLLPIPPG